MIVYNQQQSHVLMCHRQTEPYLGLYNFVGGKLEHDETPLEGAYRELFEETGISNADISLTALFTTQYFLDAIEVQVFFGTLNKDVQLVAEKHPLSWQSLDQDFSDDTRFAGQGNIKHMLDIIVSSHQRKGLIEK